MNSLDTLKHRRGVLKTKLSVTVNLERKEQLRDDIADLTRRILYIESRDPVAIKGQCTRCAMPVLDIDTECSWCANTEIHTL